jgi:RNA-directed DNA polymerase
MQQRIGKPPHTTGRSESQEVGVNEGAETRTDLPHDENLASETLMEEIVSRDNVRKAFEKVKANSGASGVDKMTVQELPGYLRNHWLLLRDQLLKGQYRPQPVRRVEIPKPDGGVRKLGIPSVLDRFIQQAVMQVLQKYWDRTFSDHSYGFRPKRSAHQAVSQAQLYIKQGFTWVVDLDLEKFFDRVNHDRLMTKVGERVKDARVIKLIRSFLTAGVMENGLVSPTDEGTPQGGPLSPFLSNIVLDELDQELTKRGHRFVRYADDSNIYARSEKAGKRVMKSVTRFITTRLKLKVNETKSAVDRPWKRKFLGFTFSAKEWRGKWQIRRKIAPKALERFKDKVRMLTRRTQGANVQAVVDRLNRYLQGWVRYFAFSEVKTEFKLLESWIKRKLRCMVWKQWATGKKRYRELRRHGVRVQVAWVTTKSGHGPWRMSRTPAVQQVLSYSYFKSLGLVFLSEAYASLSSRRTAV